MPDGDGKLASAGSGSRQWRDLGWLTLAVVLAYASAVPGDFVWLDTSEIEAGGYRIVETKDWQTIWTTTLEEYQGERVGIPEQHGGYWRPVYALSISLDWTLWGDRAWCYHLENILWHWLVVAGLYLLGGRVFGSLPESRRIVFWATMLFAVHPLGVHSVTWISGRKDTMCAAFGVAALLALSQVAADTQKAQRRRLQLVLWLVLGTACMLLSVASKELGMVLPLVATVLFWPLLRVRQDQELRRQRAVRLAGLAAFWACGLALGVYRVAVVGVWGLGANYPTDSILRNAAMSARLWWHYVGCVLTPYEVHLSDAWTVVQSIGAVDVLALLAIAVALGVLAYGAYWRWPFIPALLWYVLWMLPATGIVPLRHYRAERYLYPASWGLLLAVLMLFLASVSPTDSKLARRTPGVILTGIAVWLILTTSYTNTFWWNDATLFGQSVAQDPRHLEGRMVLAHIALNREEFAECVEQSQRILSDVEDASFVAYSIPFSVHTQLGMALLHLGSNAPALMEFQSALRYRPMSPMAHYNVGLASYVVGNLPAAKQHYAKSLELEPTNNVCRHNLAVTLMHLRQPAACVDLLREHVKSHPDDLSNVGNLASALLVLGRFQEAEPYFERLVRNEPTNAARRAQLAWCQWKTGKRDEARQNFERAKAEAPDHPIVQQTAQMMAADQDDKEEDESIEE